MRAEWTEGELEFDFSTALQTCQPDQIAEPLTSKAEPLKSVDFYVWFPDELWLIELKDPEDAPTAKIDGETKAAWSALKNDALLKEHLLPKLYGAFVHLTLEEDDISGRNKYVVIIGLTDLTNADRNLLTDKIERVIQKIGPKFRDSQYWPGPDIHNLQSWNAANPMMHVIRHR